MSQAPHVLIVHSSAETREVLSTALRRRGTTTVEAGGVQQGVELARQHPPDLIVVDLETDSVPSEHLHDGLGSLGDLGDTRPGSHTPIVVLGSVRRHGANLPDSEFIAKPYHYGPLIRRIEELLGRSASKRNHLA